MTAPSSLASLTLSSSFLDALLAVLKMLFTVAMALLSLAMIALPVRRTTTVDASGNTSIFTLYLPLPGNRMNKYPLNPAVHTGCDSPALVMTDKGEVDRVLLVLNKQLDFVRVVERVVPNKGKTNGRGRSVPGLAVLLLEGDLETTVVVDTERRRIFVEVHLQEHGGTLKKDF